MDNESQIIREHMEDTRAALSTKLGAIERQVMDTVQETTSAMRDTVEDVKDTADEVKETVSETVGSVKTFLDLRSNVDRHPYAMMAGAVAAGYIAGNMLHARPLREKEKPGLVYGAPRPAEQSDHSLLKGVAAGAIFALVRTVLAEAVPPQYHHVLDAALASGPLIMHGRSAPPRGMGGRPFAPYQPPGQEPV